MIIIRMLKNLKIKNENDYYFHLNFYRGDVQKKVTDLTVKKCSSPQIFEASVHRKNLSSISKK